jgi:hypothetical protein
MSTDLLKANTPFFPAQVANCAVHEGFVCPLAEVGASCCPVVSLTYHDSQLGQDRRVRR